MLAAFAERHWAIHLPTAATLLRAIKLGSLNLDNRRDAVQYRALERAAAVPDEEPLTGPEAEQAGRVAIIPVKGVLTRYGDLCAWGTEDLDAMFSQAGDDDTLTAIVARFDTPGGHVNGVEKLAGTIRRVKAKKPVVAWVVNAYSGGNWLASQCTEIMVENAVLSGMGSIGVYGTHEDWTQHLEQEGIKVQIVRAEGSEDKIALNPFEEAPAEAMAEARRVITNIRNLFVAQVKAERPQTSDQALTGKPFDGKQAMKLGLADREGSLDDAVKRADFLARKKKRQAAADSKNASQTNSRKMDKDKYPLLAAALGEGGVIEAGEAADAIEAALATRDGRITALEADKTTLKADADAYNAVKAELDTLRTWKANAEKSANPKGDDTTNKGKAGKEEKEASEFDELSAKYPSLMADLQPTKKQ